MEKAKQVVANLMSHDGKHKTTVDEEVRKPVVEEQVFPQRHEDVVTAVDKEVHQDHHQTIVQPIRDQQRMEEKHTYNVIPVAEKSFEHGKQDEVDAALRKEASKFKSTSTIHDVKHTSSMAPTMESEHTVHHVHHHIQPVVQREVLQPEVVHTTVPVHETHHAAAIHHETTVLPETTMEEYVTSRGKVDAATPRKINEYEGCPNLKDKELRKDERAQQAIHGH